MQLDRFTTPPPTLDLGDYILRPLRRADDQDWYAYLSDPAVTKLTSYDVQSEQPVIRFIEYYLNAYKQHTACRWALAHKMTDQLIGTCGLYDLDQGHSSAEIGYDLSRAYWGQGIMTRAVRAVLDWGFNLLAINRIQATVMVGNLASARILEKCGFQREGILRAYKICRGTPQDFWMFAQLRRDYCTDATDRQR